MAASEGIEPFRRGHTVPSAALSSSPSGPPISRRRFTAAMLGLAGTIPLSAVTTARKPISDWKVLFNDDGSNQLHGAVWPLTREELEFRIDFLVDHGIDAFAINGRPFEIP